MSYQWHQFLLFLREVGDKRILISHHSIEIHIKLLASKLYHLRVVLEGEVDEHRPVLLGEHSLGLPSLKGGPPEKNIFDLIIDLFNDEITPNSNEAEAQDIYGKTSFDHLPYGDFAT